MIKAALILDNGSLTMWQKESLDAALEHLDIRLVLNCRNTKVKRSYGKHFLYYLLNYVSLRNHLTSRLTYDAGATKVIDFDSLYDGNWQRLPDAVSAQLAESGVEIVIKFGMSLLRIDKGLERYPIFSFHHGDPRQFRGRPAGFYELLSNRSTVGTIVQTISDKLDAGKVWAICHSKVQHHSYKKTVINFYSNSKYLLRKALINYKQNTPLDIDPNGKNYRLPGNFLVMKFLSVLFARKVARVLYGAFFEKKWNIVTYNNHDVLGSKKLSLSDGKSATVKGDYVFYADSFYSADGNCIRVEALNATNGLGDIVELDAGSLELKAVVLKGKHFSYPYSFSANDMEFMAPEVASHSSPYVLKSPFGPQDKITLKGLEDTRILDGTVLRQGDIFYLFFGLESSASDCLYIFFSSSLDGQFSSHPLNPVVIDPSRARMGGRIISRGGKLFRFGQNNSFGYGDGISVCEITKLSPTEYEEKVVNSIVLQDARGPHTIDVFQENCVVDYYIDKFSLLAGYRRVAPILLRRLG